MKLSFSLPIQSQESVNQMADYPRLLNAQLWVRDFPGMPWPGTASAGGSGVNGPLIVNGAGDTAPSPGPAVNGHVPARFNGTTVSITPSNAFTIIILAMALEAQAPSTIFYDEPCLYTDDGAGYLGISYTSDGLRCGLLSVQSDVIAQPINQYFMAAMRYDGNMLRFRVNSTDADPQVVGGVAVTPYQARIGCNWDYSKFFKGDYQEIIRLAYSASDEELDNTRDYFNLYYDLSLP